ncbi:MAG TPA: hypothetical protein VFN39_09685 [Gemmatimonadaceae bacterium]|nr:hypothetical protein [Gemmatimonadaceae bacterium]
MRSIHAAVGLMVLAGCASLRRPALVQRAAASAATCDSAGSIAAERAHLGSVARTLGEIAGGAGGNAYSASETRVAAPAAPPAGQTASAAAATATMVANANTARVSLWFAEARQDLNQYEAVISLIAALDAAARTLPTMKSCRAAGFPEFTGPTG